MSLSLSSGSCSSTCSSSPSSSPTRVATKNAKERSSKCNKTFSSSPRSLSSCSSQGISSDISSSSPSSPECISSIITFPSASPACVISPISIFPSPPQVQPPPPYSLQATPLQPLCIVPASWKQHYGMEAVWIREFSQLFTNFFPHTWAIQPVACSPTGGNHLISFVDSAKVRFCCDVCGHGWTSMKGRVAFWFDLMYSYGIVAFKLYGQVCDRCKDQRYESPMWYPEEVQKVLINLYNRVGQTYYGFYAPIIEKNRRAGKPRTPHNADLCQACQDGLCSDRK